MNNEERHQESVKRYEQNPKHCLYCGKLLTYEQRAQKYCNLSCASIHRNLTTNRSHYSHKSIEERRECKRVYARERYKQNKFGTDICKYCGKVYTKTNRNQNCCQLCRSEISSLIKISDDTQYYENENHSTVHRNLIKRNGWNVKDTDVVHHIDGDKHNNSESNLLLLNVGDHNRLHRFIATERFKGSTESLHELALRYLIETGTPYGYGKPPSKEDIENMK